MATRAVARFVDRVHAFDRRVDKWVDRVRSPALDPVFYGLSSAADHGLLWLSVEGGDKGEIDRATLVEADE